MESELGITERISTGERFRSAMKLMYVTHPRLDHNDLPDSRTFTCTRSAMMEVC